MKLTQDDFDSLATKLNELTQAEQLALRVAVAAGQQAGNAEVAGFGMVPPTTSTSLHFDKIEWVWKAPAGTEASVRAAGNNLLDYEWIA